MVVIVIIVGGGWWLWKSGALSGLKPATPASQTSAAANAPQGNPSGLPTGQNDTSDAAMAQDTAAIDAQLTALAIDSTNVKNSSTDKTVTQTY